MTRVIFKETISKDELAALPVATFDGEVIVAETEEEADEAAAQLSKEDVIGLDTETKPVFSRGAKNKVALLQLSTREKCYLIRLNKIGFTPNSILRLFANDKVKKIGLSMADDLKALKVRGVSEMTNVVELQRYAPKFGITDKSLTKLYGIVFGEQISKRQRLTNWEAPQLTDKQMQYAALDAFATLSIYLCLKSIEESDDDTIMTDDIKDKTNVILEQTASLQQYETPQSADDQQTAETTTVEPIDEPCQSMTTEEGKEELIRLYTKLQGHKVGKIVELSAAGSGRKYYRISGKSGTFIGTIGESRAENRAFFALTQQFKKKRLPVPKVLSVSQNQMCYLQSDLGSVSLYDAIRECADSGNYTKEAISLLDVVMRRLPDFQFEGAKDLNFSVCYPESEFTSEGQMADLRKFQHSFLDAKHMSYDERKLEAEFQQIVDAVCQTKGETWGFMYRDFQSRNIMVKGNNPFFIDYQGGRRGPLWYDVASFVYQARANYPQKVREHLISTYFHSLQRYVKINRSEFDKQMHLFAFVRMLQVLGAYGLRGLTEGKQMFIVAIPKALKLVSTLLPLFEKTYPEVCRVLRDLSDELLPKPADNTKLTVRVFSFSYKKGIPTDESGNGGGYVFDCRGVHNPGRYERYKPLTGLDTDVIDFLEEDGEILIFLKSIYSLADAHVARYIERGFSDLMFSFGCTGGQHRSVYSAQHLAEHINQKFGVKVELCHVEQCISQTLECHEVKAE